MPVNHYTSAPRPMKMAMGMPTKMAMISHQLMAALCRRGALDHEVPLTAAVPS